MIFAAGLSLLSACEENDPIGPAPVEYVYSDASIGDITKGDDGLRYFNIQFTGASKTLDAVFVSNVYYIPEGEFRALRSGYVRSGCILVGENGSKMNGSQILTGKLNVTKDGDLYTVDGTVSCEDGTYADISYKGTMVFEPDPEPVMLSKPLYLQDIQYLGFKSLTIALATDGVSYDYIEEYGTSVLSGTGNYLAFDFYSNDGQLHPGTYTPCAVGGDVNPGEYGIGYDPGDLWGIGIEFKDWGTCWWTVENGAATAEKITYGDIVVEKEGLVYTITVNQGRKGVYCIFQGEIPELEPKEEPEPGPGNDGCDLNGSYHYDASVAAVEQFDMTTFTSTVIEGVKQHTLALMSGETQVAQFVFIEKEDATSYAGKYTVGESIIEADKMANGWDGSQYGMGVTGSWILKDGVQWLLNPGSVVTIEDMGSGDIYFKGSGVSVTGGSEDKTFDFKILGYSGSAPAGSYDSEDYTCTETISEVSTFDWATYEFTPIPGISSHSFVIKNGDAQVAQFEFITTDTATDYSGEYTVQASAAEAGLMGNGWDGSSYGMGICGSFIIKGGVYWMLQEGNKVNISHKDGQITFSSDSAAFNDGENDKTESFSITATIQK